MPWWSPGDALMMLGWWAVDALIMHWRCTEDALTMHWRCTDDVLMMRWWCADEANSSPYLPMNDPGTKCKFSDEMPLLHSALQICLMIRVTGCDPAGKEVHLRRGWAAKRKLHSSPITVMQFWRQKTLLEYTFWKIKQGNSHVRTCIRNELKFHW